MPGRVEEAEALVRAVQRDPSGVLERSLLMLDITDDERTRAIARWALGMARRELGDLRAARVDLERAWETAAGLDDLALAGRIATTLSLVVAYQGELANALAILDVSEPAIGGAALGHSHLQRGVILYQQGELDAALASYEAALEVFGDAADELGEARVHVNLGALFTQVGRLTEARVHLEQAVEQATGLEQTLVAAIAHQNLAHVESLVGDLPAAFDAFERASACFVEARYEGPFARSVRLDHARTLLQANLLEEAVEAADRAVIESEASEGDLELAESLLVTAEVHLASGDIAGAAESAERSVRHFIEHDRPAWAALARSVLLRARRAGRRSSRLAEQMAANARTLHRYGYHLEADRLLLEAAELHIELRHPDRAGELLTEAGRTAGTSAIQRAAALRITASLEIMRGRPHRARRVVNQGVRILNDHHAVLGAIELRAFAAASSIGLARIGVQLAVDDRRARELLTHLEATRRTVSLLPAAQPPDDEVLADLLARLRLATAQHRDAISAGAPTDHFERERAALERRIRWHARRAPAGGEVTELPIGESLSLLGDRALIEYADLDGRLYAVSVIGGRSGLHDLGPSEGLAAHIDSCAFTLHRLNRTQGSAASRSAARVALEHVTAELEDHVVPARVRRSGRPLVVVPAGALHGLPWSGLPNVGGRPISVSPSLTGWAIAHQRNGGGDRATLVAGPELTHAESEVHTLAKLYPRAEMLVGPDASAARCLTELARADVGHLACHGSFRADNPLFSTLTLADGPLTVYDLGRCRPLPKTLVLSACRAAVGATVRGGALLGLASALMSFGASSVVAPLTPVSDVAVVPVMDRLHRCLVAGTDAPTALATARTGSEELDPTAAAFVAIGA